MTGLNKEELQYSNILIELWSTPRLYQIPFNFLINMLPLGQIIHSHDISFHYYADDTPLYASSQQSDIFEKRTLKSWMWS